MQEVTVYRNPVQAAFWKAITSGEVFPVIAGIAVFLVVFLLANEISTRKWGSWGKGAATRTNICLVVAAVAGVATIWKMWA